MRRTVGQSRGHLLLVWVLEQPPSISQKPNVSNYKERLVQLLLGAYPLPHTVQLNMHAHTLSLSDKMATLPDDLVVSCADHSAAAHEKSTVLAYLGDTPLHIAARNQAHLPLMQLLLASQPGTLMLSAWTATGHSHHSRHLTHACMHAHCRGGCEECMWLYSLACGQIHGAGQDG